MIPQYRFALREDLKDDKRFLPTRAEPKSSGWDVSAAQEDKKIIRLKPFEYAKIPLGFRAFCPEGWWFELKPRSSTFAKKHLGCLYGTIDESYEGFLILACQYLPSRNKFDVWEDDLAINFGDPVGQIIPVKRQEMIVESISNEEYDKLCKERGGIRGTGGFGSTDKMSEKSDSKGFIKYGETTEGEWLHGNGD
jgi:dUTPase